MREILEVKSKIKELINLIEDLEVEDKIKLIAECKNELDKIKISG